MQNIVGCAELVVVGRIQKFYSNWQRNKKNNMENSPEANRRQVLINALERKRKYVETTEFHESNTFKLKFQMGQLDKIYEDFKTQHMQLVHFAPNTQFVQEDTAFVRAEEMFEKTKFEFLQRIFELETGDPPAPMQITRTQTATATATTTKTAIATATETNTATATETAPSTPKREQMDVPDSSSEDSPSQLIV